MTVTTTTSPKPRRRWRRLLAISASIVAVTALAFTFAHGVPQAARMKARNLDARMAHVPMRGGMLGAANLLRLPLGTELTIDLYAEDPSAGADPVATFAATVGETSESAFAASVQEALGDAAYATVTIGERTDRIALQDDETRQDRPRAAAVRMALLRGLEEAQTVTVAVFGTDTATAPVTTLSFTQGTDSAAAFMAAIRDATEEAAAIEVTWPATTQTIDLTAMSSRMDGMLHRGAAGMGMRDGANSGPGGMSNVAPRAGSRPAPEGWSRSEPGRRP